VKLTRALEAADRKALIAVSAFAPLLLFTMYLILRGLTFHGSRPPPGLGLVPLLVATFIGAVPLLRAPYSSLARAGFIFLYIFTYGMLLLIGGAAFSCAFFYNCD
jgi:hypothetical protein